MGRNSTFKKRRHSYQGALGLEIKVRGIVTNFVVLGHVAIIVYGCLLLCNSLF
jgi:hypothetical protein